VAEFDPWNDPPLRRDERVRIVHAYRSGNDIPSWERHMAGRSGTVTAFFLIPDNCRAIILLDPVTPRQRLDHYTTLCLWSYGRETGDVVERLPAEPGEGVGHG